MYLEWQDGRRTQPYGPNVTERLWIDPTGLFGIQVIGADRAKFKSGDRRQGTAEENATVVKMTETFFGMYTLNDAEQAITMQIERSIFPDWSGSVRKYKVVFKDDELLTVGSPIPSTAGSFIPNLLWKRAK